MHRKTIYQLPNRDCFLGQFGNNTNMSAVTGSGVANFNAISQKKFENILTIHTEVIIDDIIFFRDQVASMKEATSMFFLTLHMP